MNESEIVRNNLLDSYQKLSPLEKDVLHLCAVIHEPTTAPIVYNCFRNTRPASGYPHIVSLKALDPEIQNLQSLNLLTDRFQCHPLITEIAIRRAAECPVDGYFQDMIRTVQDMLPFSDSYRYSA